MDETIDIEQNQELGTEVSAAGDPLDTAGLAKADAFVEQEEDSYENEAEIEETVTIDADQQASFEHDENAPVNQERLAALRALAEERGIDPEILFKAIEEAMVSACKREFESKNLEVVAEFDRVTGAVHVYLIKTVVDEVTDEVSEVALADVDYSNASVGDQVYVEIGFEHLGRFAAQAGKNVIAQAIQNAEKEMIQQEYSDKIGELVYGIVQNSDRRETIIAMGRAEAILPHNQQSSLDHYDFNKRMRFLVMKVDERRDHPVILVSRSSPDLVKKLFEAEVPEIISGPVQIISIAREAGSRTKMAVYSQDPHVDPLGACVGQRGSRVQSVIAELGGEKIDIILWSDDLPTFIQNALSPAKTTKVIVFPETKSCRVVVPDDQLSLAIGKSGQNARLAAKLTGWKIDIKSESQYLHLFLEQMSATDADLDHSGDVEPVDNESQQEAPATDLMTDLASATDLAPSTDSAAEPALEPETASEAERPSDPADLG